MGKAETYGTLLRDLDDWDEYLQAQSACPGRAAISS